MTNKLSIRNPEAWLEFTANDAEDPVRKGVIELACSWAEAMEAKINAGKNLEDIAWDTFLEADTAGVTGPMAKSATRNLGLAWLYGDQLIAWHNKEAEIAGSAPSIVGAIEL